MGEGDPNAMKHFAGLAYRKLSRNLQFVTSTEKVSVWLWAAWHTPGQRDKQLSDGCCASFLSECLLTSVAASLQKELGKPAKIIESWEYWLTERQLYRYSVAKKYWVHASKVQLSMSGKVPFLPGMIMTGRLGIASIWDILYQPCTFCLATEQFQWYSSLLGLIHCWLPGSRLALSCARAEASPQHLPAEEAPGKGCCQAITKKRITCLLCVSRAAPTFIDNRVA